MRMFDQQESACSMDKLSGWKLPDQVMKLHRLKLKKKALQDRMNKQTTPATSNVADHECEHNDSVEDGGHKRHNPFKTALANNKKLRAEQVKTSESSVFEILHRVDSPSDSLSTSSFEGAFDRQSGESSGEVKDENEGRESKHIPIDWTLKTKIRFMSTVPFPWNEKLKTSEEASGITGFVRCLGSGSLDTSPNAQFHQCCLVWQHPSLSWVSLFPRVRTGAATGTSSLFASDPKIRSTLFADWSASFRSLFQLVRACQCPYFYVCANTFTCLFRAAGIGGRPDISVVLTPTTRGFRQQLSEDDVAFSMPLKSKARASDGPAETPEAGPSDEDGADEDEDEDEWLESVGVSTEEISKLNSVQSKIDHRREKSVDRTKESLVLVEGVDVFSLFNFLLNCKSSVAAVGPLAGVPPTLLAPVAFHGATLQPLRVRQSRVNVQNASFYSTEVQGPVLPHTVHDLCSLLTRSVEEFSATFANVESTCAFSLAESDSPQGGGKTRDQVVFDKEKLSDCGLLKSVLEKFCSPQISPVQLLDTVKFSNKMFTWSD